MEKVADSDLAAVLGALKEPLARHTETCADCAAGLRAVDTASAGEALARMCPDGRAVMTDIVRLRLGRRPIVKLVKHRLPSRGLVAEALRQIAATVCQIHGVHPRLLRGDSLEAAVCAARREAIARISAFGYSDRDVGRFFRRGHSAIASAVKTFKARHPAAFVQVNAGGLR